MYLLRFRLRSLLLVVVNAAGSYKFIKELSSFGVFLVTVFHRTTLFALVAL